MMIQMRGKSFCCLAGLLLAVISFCAPGSAAADQPAVTSMTVTTWSDGVSQSTTYGWLFQPSCDISVTQLGLWDEGGDGLSFAHDIGLWDSSHQLLAAATLAAGTDAECIDSFCYVPIAPVILSAGQTYALGAYYVSPTTDAETIPNSFTTASDITWKGAVWSDSVEGLSYPATGPFNNPPSGIFGPSFTYNAVPEPSTLALLATAVASVVLITWRRRKLGW